jgi:hypothetical protein
MERRELDQLCELVDHFLVEHHGGAELGAAVHDAVTDRVRTAEPVNRRVDVEGGGPRGGSGEILGSEQLIVLPDQSELQAARARVDDQNSQKGQTQSRTSSMSSPA